MEQRLARGEVVKIPVPATPPHMKHDADQLSKPAAESNRLRILFGLSLNIFLANTFWVFPKVF
jgi:hypothetical protein